MGIQEEIHYMVTNVSGRCAQAECSRMSTGGWILLDMARKKPEDNLYTPQVVEQES